MDDTGELLLRDIYPAAVYAPKHAEHEQAEVWVFVTSNRVIVHTKHGILVDEPVTGPLPQATCATLVGELVLETETGPVIVTRGQGCGCRDPLKALDPPFSRT